ncbi:MAG: MBL fold metallo-hydrolase, partial [Deltaproteobacteria bacterium]|nr:MBL fold metallo-hydrolase [Deltaproteobacteria bacterium]
MTHHSQRQFGPVRFLPGPSKGKYPHCHSVFVEGAGVLVDPASDRGALEELARAGAVSAVVLSHWHEDHLAHLDLFAGVPVWMHPADAGPLSSTDAFLNAYGLTGALRDWWRPVLEQDFHFAPRAPDRLLSDGEEVDLGTCAMRVLHTPGHTPGHLSLLFDPPGLLYLGDYDLTAFGPWYGDVDSSIEDTIASVNRLAAVPASVLVAGHGRG